MPTSVNLQPPPRPPAVNQIFEGRYHIKREIAHGGMGTVFEAEHLFAGHTVALKLPRREAATSSSEERFLREARSLARARHPGVVEILDAGRDASGTPYVAMELLEGRSLAGLLAARRRLDLETTVRIGLQVATTLAAVHRCGVLHRDVCPGNLFLAADAAGRELVKLIDFGLAQQPRLDARVTQEGSVVGTYAYMSPEQLLGREVDHRCDLYALGATLYECLAGEVPFPGTFGEVALMSSTRPPKPLNEIRREVPESVAQVISRALARDRCYRFADGDALAAALSEASGIDGGSTDLLGLVEPDGGEPAGAAARRESLDHDADRLRRHPRAPYITPVRLVLADGSFNDGHCEEIGEGGMMVVAERPGVVEERLRVRFALPRSGRVLEAQAVERWHGSTEGPVAAGLEFIDLPAEALEEIRDFVELLQRG